ncbi:MULTISPECIES: type VII secretion-associated protein [unclassified Actinopolyspora]|uniref:type VII secretion-associated protein n=1 Tax=unclassified Actinopolyspora TaxID=2639451 RepID=UPI0013F59A5F|nr:type VII secretion-associated protein [Actinopolyspora sp. BKK2]NHE75499.1 type VII secretion-associated protein [Actinopolyspora sp. BKK1]
MTLHVAVDFGTSSTCTVVSRDGGEPHVVAVDGQPLVSSAVFAAEDGALFVGQEAERQAAVDPARFEPHPKRRIDEGELLLGETVLTVVDAVRAVLDRVVEEARRHAGGAGVDLLVLTHPAEWGAVRTDRLRRAAGGMGSEVVLVPEPVGAAVFHSAGYGLPEGAALAVLDLGGGTVDASLVRRSGDGFRVRATRGEPDFGGADIDQALLEHIGGIAEPSDPEAWRELVEGGDMVDRRRRRVLRQDVRGAKETLSRHSYTDVPLPPPFSDAHVTRSDLESLIVDSLGGVVELVREVLREGGVTADERAGVFLVGGSSRVPLVARLIHERLGTVPTTLDQPETVVARGALRAVRTDPGHGRTSTLRIPGGSATGAESPRGGPAPPVRDGRGRGSAARAVPAASGPTRAAPTSPPLRHLPSARGAPGGPNVAGSEDPTTRVPAGTGSGRRSRTARWIGGSAVVLLLGITAALSWVFLPRFGGGTLWGGAERSPASRESGGPNGRAVRYGYEFEYPKGWHQGGGSPELWETRIRPPGSGPDPNRLISVRAGELNYDVEAGRERSVRELRGSFDRRVSEGDDLSGFEPDGEFAGQRVVHYEERLGEAVVDWYLLHRGHIRISVGCQYGPSRGEPVRSACAQVVRTVAVR